MAESLQKGYKTLWEKEKLLFMSNFSFSDSVFKRLVLETRKNPGLFGKGLKHSLENKWGFQMTIFRLPKLKELADNNFKSDENARKFSKSIENSVGKGEITCYKQFLLFPQCFQTTSIVNM